ncbi:cell division protein FtsZ [Bacteroides coprosuis DSM 18011]|uniref:Cell division protein FtsZ n=1 Tax=Bacteroides coprosuis DSM 18011 TaxID=679937 RepID=F3ZQB0_9BACE|nr:cell division protein FtsZ [Bacteroides coprosuis DSM 18011]
MDTTYTDIMDLKNFDIPTNSPKIIKVIGVGGGGGNAVSHMFTEGIHDVSFVLCNTDNQALLESPVPVKIQLGKETTYGLGAGNKPDRAKEAAEESLDEIEKILNDGTKMVFITAGMGGGTGTGAAPIIARTAKDMGILTVGIVTIPFLFEGEKKIIQALDGVEKLAQSVDALLVINNERLREIHSDLTLMNAFAKADDTLSIAAKSIAELITKKGKINLDFADVNTILKDGGVAIMSTGIGKEENRLSKAIKNALNSPLLNNNDIFNAKKVMLNIYCSEDVMMDEINEVHDFMSKFRDEVEVIWGMTIEKELGKDVKVTILATGFGVEDVPGMSERREQRTKEEEDTIMIEEEKKREIIIHRIKAAYGENAINLRNRSSKRQNHIYLFTSEDLDNDNVIAEVEETPTYERTKSKLNIISNITSQGGPRLTKSEDNNPEDKVIKF